MGDADYPLDHPHRVRLYEILEENPGLNRSQLQRAADLSNGVTEFHLNVLEREEKLVRKPGANDKEVLFFTEENQHLWNDPHTRILLGSGFTRNVALLVAETPGITSAKLGRELDLKPVSVRYHLSKLQDRSLVSSFRVGNEVRYLPTDRLETWSDTFADRYEPEHNHHNGD